MQALANEYSGGVAGWREGGGEGGVGGVGRRKNRNGGESGECCTAVLLFPTKALAQDQLQTMRRYLTRLAHELASADDGGRTSSSSRGGETPRFHCATLDGDTSFADRGDLQRTATVILTNPDTLHASILPRHKDHQRLLSGLRYIVIDEVL